MAKTTTNNLFGDLDELTTWREHWKDMPEFIQNDLQPIQQIVVVFESKKDKNDFAKLVNQKLTDKTKSIWFPEKDHFNASDFAYVNNENNKNNAP